MSGWVDPLGVRALYRYIQAEMYRLDGVIAAQHRPDSHRLARYRARQGELGRLQALLQQVERPGAELCLYKALVNLHADRPDRIRDIDSAFHAFLQQYDAARRAPETTKD